MISLPIRQIYFPRLHAIAADLQCGDIGRAMISAVLLGFGEMSDDGMNRLTRAEALSKFNFNPAEPRDRQGRWARDEAAGLITPIRAGGPVRGQSWPRRPRLGKPAQRRFSRSARHR